MSIKIGDLVRVRKEACDGVRGLNHETTYRVFRAEPYPPAPVRIGDEVRTPHHTVTLELPGFFTEEQKRRWENLVEVHVEDCVHADLVPTSTKARRQPVDRAEVLLRLRRDFCLKYGRYPTKPGTPSIELAKELLATERGWSNNQWRQFMEMTEAAAMRGISNSRFGR